MTIRQAGAFGSVFLAIFLSAAASSANAACTPKVEGPVPVTATSKIYERKAPPAGMRSEEFFVSCDIAEGHYKTLVHVTLPDDPAKQSGIVIAEPWHPVNDWSLYSKINPYLTDKGHVSVIIVGNPYVLEKYIKPADPVRFGSLTLPGKGGRDLVEVPPTTENEVIGQVGALIKSGGIPGLNVRKVILGGMSQTGAVVRAYIAYEHATPGAKSVYDGYFPEQTAVPSYKGPLPDLDVPVVELQGEREAIVTFERNGDVLKYRRPDGPLYRLYEVPGLPHINTRGGVEPAMRECAGHPITDFPTDMVYAAALDDLIAWVDNGIPAPHIARMQTSADGRQIHRDKYGNAMGGFRVSYFDAPFATYNATWGSYTTTATGPSDALAAKCDMIGWTNRLPADTLKTLYPTHAAYVAKVRRTTAALVGKRELLPKDAAVLNDEAQKADVP